MARPERIYKRTRDWYYSHASWRDDDTRVTADYKKGYRVALDSGRLACRDRDRQIADLTDRVRFLEAGLAVESAKHAALIEAFAAMSGKDR